ncbi:MAG: YggS family pyridoxal phosphate-dependent enzyme [Phocaeicola sp.]|nr:YggS family pyridoxal phosphate-dependent enzyme [Phocaeicola sp.]
MSIKENLQNVLRPIPSTVTLVAVSKFHPASAVQAAYEGGQRIFGESRVQELEEKRPLLPVDISWHFIGHLQRNKVKYIAPYIDMIHAVDTLPLLQEINKEAQKHKRTIRCLLEIHIAQEESKYGFSMDECRNLLKSEDWEQLTCIEICGLMGMATFTDDTETIAKEFSTLQAFFQEIKATHFSDKPYFKELSMGMSDDYLIAIEQGSTMVRVGSKIFGHRSY